MRQILIPSLMAFCLLAPAVRAGELPRWELGLGLAGLSIPDYRGSDEQRGYLLPLPYVQYRGEIFQIDREGAHGSWMYHCHILGHAEGGMMGEMDVN